jgi:hypothetical protein
MPRAVVLNSASKANTTGGTFADTLTANSGDSLSIPNLQSGQGKILRMWGVDSDAVAELALTAGRVESIHDPQYGIRMNIPALALGGAGTAAAFPLIEPPNYIDVFTGDTLTMTVTTTAADDVLISWLTEYQDLPGVQASFATWDSVKANRFTEIGVRCAPVASGTPGLYGTARAVNADDTRWTGGRWYAILGFTVQTVCTTVSFKGPMWGNFRFGASAGGPFLNTDNYFLTLGQQFPGEALIPVFNGYDAGNVLLEVADGEASTNPKIDIIAVECRNNPATG